MSKLFYTRPSREWEQALPIGCGRLGAMVYGGAQKELIQLNEENEKHTICHLEPKTAAACYTSRRCFRVERSRERRAPFLKTVQCTVLWCGETALWRAKREPARFSAAVRTTAATVTAPARIMRRAHLATL